MAFKYINPGYAELISAQPTYEGEIIDSDLATHKNKTYSPKLGVAFSGGASRGMSIQEPDYGETVYFKFDLYLPREDEDLIEAFVGFADGCYIAFGCDFGEPYVIIDNAKLYTELSYNDSDTHLNFDAVNTIWIRFKNNSDEENDDGELTVTVNGNTIAELNELYLKSRMTTELVIYAGKAFISNLIVSSEEIFPDEEIICIEASDFAATMTASDTGYVTASTEDYVLQHLDMTNLYGRYGRDGKILGMLAVAAPAYTTGTDVTKLKCRTVINGVTVDYDAQILGTDSDCVLAQSLPVDSDTTFQSLNGAQIGWVTEN